MVDIPLELMAELVVCIDELEEDGVKDIEELVGMLEDMAEDDEDELAAELGEELDAMLEDDGEDEVIAELVVVVVVARYGTALDIVAEKDIPVLDKDVEDAAMLLLEEDIATLELDGAVELLLG